MWVTQQMPEEFSTPVGGEAPSPDGGWSSDIARLSNALIVPPVVSELVQPCGVLDSNGEFCPYSATWRGRKQMMTAPDMPKDKPKELSGRHLFAGQLWAHFGHFIAESTSRLWALDSIKKNIDSILFIPKRPGRTLEVKGYQREFFDLLGIDIPIHVIDEPTRVEKLMVPGQGFGLGEIAGGTLEFRRFFSNNFATDVKPGNPENLYLSRSGLGGLEGGIVLEDHLEQNLVAQGYQIYHPQDHSLTDQIARYRGARKIIGLDGSAFHLFAFVGQPDQKVAVILRRNSNVFHNLRNHIESFSGISPTVLNLVQADWIPSHKNRPGRLSFGQLDFDALGQNLWDAGFIDGLEKWEVPKFRKTVQAMEDFSKSKGVEFKRVRKPPAKV